jgi:hypothetical protein
MQPFGQLFLLALMLCYSQEKHTSSNDLNDVVDDEAATSS